MRSLEATLDEFPLNGSLITVRAEWQYQWEPYLKGCRTLRNGDPGWPDEGGYAIDVEPVRIIWACDDEQDFPKEEAESLLPALQSWFLGGSNESNAFSEWLDARIAESLSQC